jgi:hypothetical protein
MKMPKLLNTHKKNAFGVILGLGLVVLIVVLFQYNSSKSNVKDGMVNDMNVINNTLVPNNTQNTVKPMASDNNYLPVASSSTIQSASSSTIQSAPPMNLNPTDLLPKDSNSDWASVNPASNDLQGINLLTAGQLIGINTVGSTLRNPNLQVRSEPVIPKVDLGPWNQSTIEPDQYQRPLEFGQAGQNQDL